MRLTKLSITNFRSIADKVVIDVPSQHVALVGSNNSGKSSIVSALEWVLGNRTPYNLHAERSDFFDPASAIVIEAQIGDIGADDKGHLMGIATNQKQRGALSGKGDAIVTLTLTIPSLDVKPADDDEQDDTSSPTKPTLELNLWGFGVYQKTTDKRRSIAQTVVVGANRRVSDDLQASRWTPYGQLMKSVLEASPQYDELSELLAAVNDKIQEIFVDEKTALLSQARVVSYVDDVDFQLTKDNNPAELLRYLEILITEGGRQSNLSQVGSGTQSAIIIGMLELVLRSKTSRVRVFAIEEPDAFIHPHGVRHLAGLIEEIGESGGTQVVLTTHSPALLAVLHPRDIVRVEKRADRTEVFQSPGTLADPEFARFINPDTAEMFFAQRAVLVEGDTERFLLPPLSRMLSEGGQSLDFDRRQLSIVVMDGKDNTVNYLKILDEFKIESRAILDADFLSGSSCATLVKYLRSRGKSIDDSTQAQLRKDLWAQGILVLQKGEIEDYVPEADVATLTGRSIADIQSEKFKAKKTSDAFKALFHTNKPIYARRLAEHYVQSGAVPHDLARLIKQVAS